MIKSIFTGICFLSTILFLSESFAQEAKKDLSHLRELLNTKVTTVSRTPEDPFRAPAATHVITKKDIERAGATSVAEALRLAPGMQVAQVGSNWWSISARGFNDQLFNKLLVLIDGRTVYTPLFGGMYWDTKDLMLEDIKHIEVIRGPAGSLWGANAVNGIVNIITEEAVNTLDKLVTVTVGNNERIVNARLGGKLGNDAHYRIYSRIADRDSFSATSEGNSSSLITSGSAQDSWTTRRAGFRADWDHNKYNNLTLQGDLYNTKIERFATLPVTGGADLLVDDSANVTGGNMMAKWSHVFENGSNTELRTYIDSTRRKFNISEDKRDTFDIDFQHSFNLLDGHYTTWGANYRYNKTDQPFRPYFIYNPISRSDDSFSFFGQDKVTLLPEELFLTVGFRLEHNEYTNFEFQPNARLAWHINDNNTAWASVSRAVRTPSRAESDILQIIAADIPGLPPAFVKLNGNDDFDSEKLTAYEIGYKARLLDKLSFDTSAFYYDYNNLRTLESSFSGGSILLTAFNFGEAESYGAELSTTWDVTNIWRLSASYSFLTIDTHIDSSSTDTSLVEEEGKSPKNQVTATSRLLLPHNVELNNTLYFVDNLSSIDVDSYVRFDSRLAWKPRHNLELSLVGQNLFDGKHREFRAVSILPQAEVERSVYARLSITF